ncbi:tetratricopeptide repeat protein [Rhabdochromatium marinum]|uniref:tetratricopeptide repeat protein n=1 Tax=Rhabdochromatium marinum TaxID=48729 RepID=UPI001906630B|nr:glycosyltransferase family 41 protein [Rhabdochromatium marinum]MBK1647612.1 hypothetical protein [Rhabdochromatium marinum]
MYPDAIIPILNTALACHQRGELDTALVGYDAVIQAKPDLPEIHVNRGNVLQALGRPQEAIAAFDAALQLAPQDAVAHFNRGNTLRTLDRLMDALADFEAALSIRPDFFEAHLNRGIILKELARFDEALAAYDAALAIQPDFVLAHYSRGIVLTDLQRFQEALAAYDAALRIRPDYAKAHNNRSHVLELLGRRNEALASCKTALQMKPDYAEAHLHLGLMLKGLDRLEEALASLDAALSLRPDCADAHYNRGLILNELGRRDDALVACDAALRIQPESAAAHYARANVLKDLGQLGDALTACDAALRLQPEFLEAHNTRGGVLMQMRQMDEAVAAFAVAANLKPDFQPAHSNRLFALHYCEQTANGAILSAARQFGAQFDQPTAGDSHPNPRQTEQRLRIGYVSGDFWRHPVGYFLQGVLPHHDPAEVEVYCYSTQAARDDLTDRLEACVHGWKTLVGLDDHAAANQIRADAIDILIDLSGHTRHNRLLVFAQRPAPVQVSWLGYFGTTGLAAMDYILADSFVIHEGEEQLFSERVWRLPFSYLCFNASDVRVAIEPHQTSADTVTFASFNNLAKLSQCTIALWCRLLAQVPDSRLVIRDKALADASVRRELQGAFFAQGIHEDRLLFESMLPRNKYLAGYNRVDIALSPTPFGGGTTTAEALWMGVPVVALRGHTWVGRISDSILSTVGLPELVARDEEDYIAIAASLAKNAEWRAWLRTNLRSMVMKSPLGDGQRFTRDLEAAYRGMWRLWCTGSAQGT